MLDTNLLTLWLWEKILHFCKLILGCFLYFLKKPKLSSLIFHVNVMSYINSDTWFCLAFQFWLAAFLPGSSDIWRSQIVVVLVVRVLFDFTTRDSHSGSEESNKMQNVHLFCNHLLMENCIFFFSQLVFVSTMKIYQVLSFYEVLWKQGGKKK